MSPTPSPAPDLLQTRLRQIAEAALVVGDYEAAITAALTVQTAHPNATNTALLGRVYYFAEEWELAQPLLEEASLASQQAQIMLGWIHVFLGLWQDKEETILRGQAIHQAALSQLDHSLDWLRPHLALMNYNYLVAGQDSTVGTRWGKGRLAAAALDIGNYAAVDELTENDSSLLFHRAKLFFHWIRWADAIKLLDAQETTLERQIYRGWCQLLIAQAAVNQVDSLSAAKLIADCWAATPVPTYRVPARRLLLRRRAHSTVLRQRGFVAEADAIDQIDQTDSSGQTSWAPPGNVSALPRLIL